MYTSLVRIKKGIETETKLLQVDYDLTDKGDLLDYLGIRFDRKTGCSVSLTQPRMIERVLKLVGFDGIEENFTRYDT